MIEIKCAADNTAILCERCNVQADVAWEMVERGERLGFSLVTRTDDRAQIVWLEAPDAALFDALFRATLNALSAQGVTHAVLQHENAERFAAQKGYFSPSETKEIEIREFFSKSACKG